MSIRSACVKCHDEKNTNGLFTCNGCTDHFCTNHIQDHTNELRNRFEQIVDEYNVVKEIFEDCKQKYSDRQRKLIDRLERELQQIKYQLDQCQKTSNYSEDQSEQWMNQLKRLQKHLINMKSSVSFWIKHSKVLLISLLIGFVLISVIFIWTISFRPSFTKPNEVISLSHFRKTAEHIGQDYALGSVRVNPTYKINVHHIRLVIEKLSPSSKSFIGVINEQSNSPSPYRWPLKGNKAINPNSEDFFLFRLFRRLFSFFGSNRHIQPNDILDLEINCTNARITLQNLRTQQKYPINIDLKRCPFPWQIILNLDRRGDRIHIF